MRTITALEHETRIDALERQHQDEMARRVHINSTKIPLEDFDPASPSLVIGLWRIRGIPGVLFPTEHAAYVAWREADPEEWLASEKTDRIVCVGVLVDRDDLIDRT